MPPCCLLCFLVLCYFPILLAHPPIQCPLLYHCKNTTIYFPLTDKNSSECGLQIRGCDDSEGKAEVQLGNHRWYPVERGPYGNSIVVQDEELEHQLSSKHCSVFDNDYNISLPISPISFHTPNIMIMYKCNRTLGVKPPGNFHNHTCPNSEFDVYYGDPDDPDDNYWPDSLRSCSKIQLPIQYQHPMFFQDPKYDLFKVLTSRLYIEVVLPQECQHCYETTDICLYNNGRFSCASATATFAAAKEKKRIWKVIVGSVIAVALGIIIIALVIYRRRATSSAFKYQSRNISGHPHSNGDLECSGTFFGIPVFSYKELEEATNNFDHARELGDGGFGIVYYGKLRDGREVAVKRLYEHNYKRVQQFMTEIEILTRLRHRNLVTLYGCTSRHSRELLLVYEYIPNGTVAGHLHGDLGKPGSLPWPVRMRIAVETASALAYLHSRDIIHRDVKTNNILLDNHFCVKVADFGLSRLFPSDVTHVSTAPQGTPGYLDPEYHLCYQLTTKSDVYSFGVVLIELISSMLAVDITRIKDEINLANLALKKIRNSALSELVDPSLGFESDDEVRRMIVSVAELAFQCLQMDRELRPSMGQVLCELERIENGTDELEHLEEEDLHEIQISNSMVHLPPSLSPENDEVGSLKNLKTPRLHHTD